VHRYTRLECRVSLGFYWLYEKLLQYVHEYTM